MRHARWFYPGWICRFYVADDVPQGVVSRLRNHGAEVIQMGQYQGHEARVWRFLATVDPEVDISICRDTDSRFGKHELMMVNEWLASDKKFHVMYRIDWFYPILAGMWGVRGTIPEFKEPLENFIQSQPTALNRLDRHRDQRFIKACLYPMTKGDVYVHEGTNPRNEKRKRWFIGEQIQPLTEKFIKVGRPRRMFMALSIYKNIPLYEYFLAKFIGIIEDRNLFRSSSIRGDKTFHFNVKFYVADNIRPDLVERLRRLGQVIMKPAKTVHKDDPQYWKLSILAENNLALAMIIGFWELFFLARAARQGFRIKRTLLNDKSTGIKSQFRNVTPLGVCGPDIPLAQIEDLVAQRNPDASYQEFVCSTLYPQLAPVISNFMLYAMPADVGIFKGWSSMLLPVILDYDAMNRIKTVLRRVKQFLNRLLRR